MTKRIDWRSLGKRLGHTLGFTLIEMAIVLVVIGLIVSGGLVAVGPVVENARINETNQKLDRIEQALIVYAVRNSCLPCPAASNATAATATLGQAVDDAPYDTTTQCADAACQGGTLTAGVVPWVNLGLSEADVTDSFGGRISYNVTPALTLSPSGTTSGLQREGSNYPAGTIEVQNNAGTVVTAAAAYVLISHGPDRLYGYNSGVGTQVPATGSTFVSTFETANSDDATNGGQSDGTPAYRQDVYAADKDGSPSIYFDDLVRWRSAPMIIQQCGANSCGNPL